MSSKMFLLKGTRMNAYDIDLNPVLEGASNEELEMIAKQMDERVATSLTGFDEYNEAKRTGDYTKISRLLAAELREFGGNTIANITRIATKDEYQGPPYKEIVFDVAKKFKKKPSKNMSCEQIEELIIEKLIEKMWDELSAEEKEELLRSVGGRGNATYAVFTVAMRTFIRNTGFMPYKLSAIILNALSRKILGRGLSLAVGNAFMKTLSVALGTFVNILLWGWLVSDFAFSPAFRVTTPCVILVALSRQRQLAEARVLICPKCENECNKLEHQFCPKCGAKLGD
jgi:uncharacterized protein YaaW (UPF0174 family)